MISVCPNFISSVPDKAALSAQLKSSDEILCWMDAVSNFSYFTQTNRMLLFTINNDGYPDTVTASIAAILSAAATYNATRLHYNLEWSGHTWSEKVTRLTAIRAALVAQGNTIPMLFSSIYSEFLSHYSDFAPYIDGYSVQLQNVAAADEIPDAIDAIAKAHAAIPGCPVEVQIRCYATDRVVSQVVNTCRRLSRISGLSGINLFFGPVENWSFCQQVLNIIRKV